MNNYQSVTGIKSETFHGNWRPQLDQIIMWGLQKYWWKMETDSCFHLRHCPHCYVKGLWVTQVSLGPLPAWHHHLALTVQSARPNYPPWRSTEEEHPVRMQLTGPLVLYYFCVAVFHGLWHKTAQRWASTTAIVNATGRSCMNSINHPDKSSQLSSICQWQCASSRGHLDQVCCMRLTLADESLAGV